MRTTDPFLPENSLRMAVTSPQDLLLFALDAAVLYFEETLADVSEDEYDWEPLSDADRIVDVGLPPERKRAWRVYILRKSPRAKK